MALRPTAACLFVFLAATLAACDPGAETGTHGSGGGGAGGSSTGAAGGSGGSSTGGDCSAPACVCDTCWASEACKGTPHDAAVDACIKNPEGLEVVKITTDPFAIAAGEEVFMCQNFANPLGQDVAIARSESYMTKGSHHMFAFEAPGVVNGPLEPCSGLELTRSFHTSQSPYNEFAYPPGVAVNFPASEGVRVNAHYLNTSGSSITGQVTTVFYLAKPGTVQHYAAHLFLNNIAILVAPHSTQTVTKTCPLPKDVMLLAGASHMHQYGKHFIAKAGGTTLYETTNWADPPFKTFDPPLPLAQGTGITFACDYDNPTSQTLTFGESAATNEMCIFSARYYPSNAGETIECL